MSSSLDRIATVAFVVTCVAVIAFVGYREFGGGSRPDRVSYRAGDRLEPVIQSELSPGRSNLIIKLASTCEYCTMSMPQFRRLIETAKDRWPALTIVTASSEPRNVVGSYLQAHNVSVQTVIGVGEAETVLAKMVIPSVVSVTADGTVSNTWLGIMTPSRLEEVIATLDEELCADGCPVSPRSP